MKDALEVLFQHPMLSTLWLLMIAWAVAHMFTVEINHHHDTTEDDDAE